MSVIAIIRLNKYFAARNRRKLKLVCTLNTKKLVNSESGLYEFSSVTVRIFDPADLAKSQTSGVIWVTKDSRLEKLSISKYRVSSGFANIFHILCDQHK